LLRNYWKSSEYCIVNREVVSHCMMSYFVKRTLYQRMFVETSQALEAKGVAAGERERLFL